MTDQLRANMRGLVTEPSRILAGEEGFAVLENATCKSAGLVEPRGGQDFYLNANALASGYNRTNYARQWQGHTWCAMTDGTNTRIHDGDGASVATISGLNPNVRAEPFADRQAWVFDGSIRMLDKPDSTDFTRMPGAPRAPAVYARLVTGTATPAALPATGVTAYRVVGVYHIETSDGARIVVGAPSDRVTVRNTSAGTLDVSIKIMFNAMGYSSPQGRLELQVYRVVLDTTPATSDPGDDMRMVHTHMVNANDTITGTYTWVDDATSDSARTVKGPPLYTNASQEGLLQSNYRIPLANDVAYYNGMAFYGGARRGYTKTLTCFASNTSAAFGLAGQGRSMYSVQFQGTLVAGGGSFSSVTAGAFPYFALGQQISLVGTDPSRGNVTQNAFLASFNQGAGTITLDKATWPGVAGTVITLIAWDWVGITLEGGPVTQYSYDAPRVFAGPPLVLAGAAWQLATYEALGAPVYVTQSDTGGTDVHGQGGSDMERAWALKWTSNFLEWSTNSVKIPRLYTVAQAGTENEQKLGTLLRFEWDDSTATSSTDFRTLPFAVISSRIGAFSIPLENTSYGAFENSLGISEMDGGVNRMWWSKLLQPEAVPLLQYNDLGDASSPIVRVIATNDRLWIFKTDGLWSVYGDTPDTLTFQQVDPTCRMTATTGTPGLGLATSTAPWVTRLGNQVYAWTNAGIYAISSAGQQRIDAAIETDIRMWSPSNGVVQGGGLFSGASIADDLVVFGISDVTGAVPAMIRGLCYAYHVGSRTWSTWSQNFGPNIMVSFMTGSGETDGDGLLLGGLAGYMLYRDVPRNDYAATANPTGAPPLERADRLLGAGAPVYEITDAFETNATYVTAISPVPTGTVFKVAGEYFMALSTFTSGMGDYRAIMDHEPVPLGVAEVYFPIAATITYAASTTGAPSVYKRFDRAYFGFQQMRGGLLFGVAYRVRMQGASSSTSSVEYFPDPNTITTLPNAIGLTEDTEFESMRDVPTEQTQGSGLAVTLTFQQACMYYAIDAITVTYKPMRQQLGGRS